MSIEVQTISAVIEKKLAEIKTELKTENTGTIVSLQDGVLRISGLDGVKYGEKLLVDQQHVAIALNLEQDLVGAVVLGSTSGITSGMQVHSTNEILSVPVGEALLGRVVNALGEPIDELGDIATTETSPVEKIAPGVIDRKSVDQPLQTGLKAIDSMVPIGRGQRELIIGDRQTGKTTLAVDAIINQKDTGVKCIYVAIGQKASSVASLVRKLTQQGAMQHTIVVVAGAAEAAALQYIAPYAACSMGEYFRDRGQDALIVYDDLTKHAYAYRQISLLLRRPPGREAYPGDVFYLHSRLLERASRITKESVKQLSGVENKTGSLTALPIIETQAGDVSAFIPTNVISITDGQIFLDTDLFNSGIRPAINAGISVSRVGGAAQTKIIKKLGGGVRLALAQYRELAQFAQFAQDLDEATRKQLERGQRITEVLKQVQYQPLSVAIMGLVLYAANNGYLDPLDLTQVANFEKQLITLANAKYKELLEQINSSGNYDEHIAKKLDEICKQVTL